MISKYNEFIFENVISESMLYITNDLVSILSKMDDNIADDILSVVGTDVKPDITFLDISNDDYINFLTIRNFAKSLEDNFTGNFKDINSEYNRELIKNLEGHPDKYNTMREKSRNKVKVGRLVNQIFPGKYLPKDIELFVNKFKSVLNNEAYFELVSGEDIAFWYDSCNYMSNKGSLGGSCMSGKRNIFSLYTKSENCQLLILREGNKIKGRALVWKLDYLTLDDNSQDGDIFFMDRQYTNDDSDVFRFKKYASSNGWVIKARNSHSSLGPVIFKDIEYNYSEMQVSSVKNLERFPYVDTFRVYNPSTGKLINLDPDECDREKVEDCYELSDTSGGYSEIYKEVYSEYTGDYIRNDYAVWSEYHDSYIHRDSAVNLSNDWYMKGSSAVCYSDYKDDYFLRDRCVWSNKYDTYIPEETSSETITDIDDNGDILDSDWFDNRDEDNLVDIKWISKECLSKLTIEDKYKYVHSDIVTKTDEGYAFDMFTITTYKVVLGDESDIDIYLPEGVARSLKFEINKEKYKTTDSFILVKDILAKEKTISLFRNKPIVTLLQISDLDYYHDTDDSRFINVINRYYI